MGNSLDLGMPRQARLDAPGTLHQVMGRGRRIAEWRRLFCQLAVKKMGYPGAEVAHFLGVTTSLVNRYASSEEMGNLDQYL
jgi:hypothetical protein